MTKRLIERARKLRDQEESELDAEIQTKRELFLTNSSSSKEEARKINESIEELENDRLNRKERAVGFVAQAFAWRITQAYTGLLEKKKVRTKFLDGAAMLYGIPGGSTSIGYDKWKELWRINAGVPFLKEEPSSGTDASQREADYDVKAMKRESASPYLYDTFVEFIHEPPLKPRRKVR